MMAGKSKPTPISTASRDALVYTLAVALRRLLIISDKRRSAARFAAEALELADEVLRLGGAMTSSKLRG